MELVKVKGKEEFQEDEGQTLANSVIKKRFLMNLIKLSLPYFVFSLNFGVITYSVLFPDELRIVLSTIFFIFSLIFIKFYGKISE